MQFFFLYYPSQCFYNIACKLLYLGSHSELDICLYELLLTMNNNIPEY